MRSKQREVYEMDAVTEVEVVNEDAVFDLDDVSEADFNVLTAVRVY